MTGHVYLERANPDPSLSSWILTTMAMAYEAQRRGLTPCVRWMGERTPSAYRDRQAALRCANLWEWYFEQPFCSLAEAGDAPVMLWEKDMDAHRLATAPAETISAFYRQHLRFNRAVAARACDLAARHHLDLSRTLAVAWRGTDKKTEATVIPIERYFPVIDRLLREEPDLVLFSKPEEEGVLAALRSRYPLVTFPGFFLARTGEEQMADRVNPASGYERGMQAALLIYFYSQAKYLLRNASSLADVAAFLSAGTVIQVEKSC